MKRLERRGAPRIPKRVPLVLTHEARDFTTRTENLSSSGAYCTVRRFVPPMTKLQIRLELMDRLRKPVAIICQGIVVRVEPSTPNPHRSSYKIAVFFSDLTDHHRTALARYVQHHQQGASSPR